MTELDEIVLITRVSEMLRQCDIDTFEQFAHNVGEKNNYIINTAIRNERLRRKNMNPAR